MGRPPSNGGPSFRFNSGEVAEMESILQAHKFTVPERDLCQALAEKFSCSAERDGKVVIQMKQIWNWFQNRRYAIRAKNSRAPGKLNIAPLQRNDLATVRSVSQAPQHLPVPQVSSVNNMLHVPQPMPGHSGQNTIKNGADNSQMEFEAKSSRDGAWYDVSSFLSHRSLENGGPAVLVRFAGFGPEEDEWINVQKNVRLRSLPCESSECVAVLPNDLILCFQEGKEQALYYDAHVLDAQRRRHDVRGCRCRFLVRYDHDQSEEIVPLRKVCRRPETDYRLQQLHADSANSDQNKSGSMPHPGNPAQVYPVTVVDLTGTKAEIPAQTTPKRPVTGVHPNTGTAVAPVSLGNAPSKISAVPSNAPLAPGSAGAVKWSVSMVTDTVPVADTMSNQPMTGVNANTGTVISLVSFANTSVSTSEVPIHHSNAPASAGAVDSNVSSVITTVSVDDTTLKQPTTGVNANTGTVISPVSFVNTSVSTSEVPIHHSNAPASAGAVDSNVSSVITTVSVDDTTLKQPTTGVNANTGTVISPVSFVNTVSTSEVPIHHSNAPASAGAVDSNVSSVITTVSVDDTTLKQPTTGVNANTGTVISPVSFVNTSVSTSEVPIHHSNAPASAGAVDSNVSSVITTVSVDDTTLKQPTTGVNANTGTVISPVSFANTSVSTSEVPIHHSNAPASAGAVDSNVSSVITTVSVDDTTLKQPTTGVNANTGTVISPVSFVNTVSTSEVPIHHSNAPASAGAVDSNVSSVITTVSVDDTTLKQPTTGVNANTGTVISPVSLANTSVNTSEVPMNHSNVLLAPASVGSVDSSVPTVTNTASVADTTPMYLSMGVNPNTGTVMAHVSLASPPVDISAVPNNLSNASLSPESTAAVVSSVPMVTYTAPVADTTPNQHTTGVHANSETLISPANTSVNTSDVPMNYSNASAPASAVDSSVSKVAKAGCDTDSSRSLTSTVGPATINAPVVTQLITSMENLAGPTTTQSEGTMNVVDSDVGEASSANIGDAPGDSDENMQIG